MPSFVVAGLIFPLLLLGAAPVPNAPIPPDKAPAKMTVPDGFRVTLFAGEPDVVKPIAMTTDDRGRLWVVESHSYPNWITDGKEGRDRVLIFADTNGTGHFDSCKVFLDKGTNLSGITLGHGGVWLTAVPNLLFIPMNEGEDKPAGKPIVVLDGWDLKAKHNVFNTLVWGPDGYLYGCNGILSNSRVGKPGTPDKERVALNCGVWRYHPTRQRFEQVASGTTNPWGLDFDDYGEIFITNCVIKHLFHVVPGGHYQRMYGQDLDANSFGLMESCADHIHWGGGDWTSSRNGEGAHGDAGGGHAHVGAMVYLGDNWPDEYRQHLFTCNLHGNRVNQDVLERKGSGYVAHHGKDFLFANDPWFRGLALLYGPDGGVFVADWNDTGECHNYDHVTPTNGRIYKITYGDPIKVNIDLAKLSDDELVKLQLHKNDWQVRHARRLLQERTEAGKLGKGVKPQLLKLLGEQKDVPRKLRLLWALYAVKGLDEKALMAQLDSADDMVRVWAVRLLLEDAKVSDAVAARFAHLAKNDSSATVRLALASALQRLPLKQRWPVAEALVAHGEDAKDMNLPLMIWYGVEDLVPTDPDRAAALLGKSRIPLVRQYIARRIAAAAEADKPKTLTPLVKLLAEADDTDIHLDILRGLYEALQGRKLDAPAGWPALERKLAGSPHAEVRQKSLMLSVMFGDKEALASLRTTVTDATAKDDARRLALQTLVEVQAPNLDALLRDLLADKTLRGPALRGLAAYKDTAIPPLILKNYATCTDAEKADAINTLASRIEYALVLMDAVEKNQVPRRDVSAFTARQLFAYNNKALTEKVNQAWGSLRPPAQEKTALLNRYKSLVPPDALKKADRAHGRAVFAKSCATCHTLFNEGGKIGPELTGSQRANPEYILSKVVDPSAVVARDFQMTVLDLKNGRSVSGLVKSETEKTVTMQTQNEVVLVNKTDIDERKKSSQSMMPDGLFVLLSDADIRDLIAYLGGAEQVALPSP